MSHPRFCVAAVLAALVAFLSAAPPLLAWHDEGHTFAAVAAVEALGEDDAPAFFRTPPSAAAIAHCALDPDLHAERALACCRDAEGPGHFLDLELLNGRDLPATRHAYIALCAQLHVDPKKAGYLPWTVAEMTQRLTWAFAEHRRWPDDPFISAKILVYAGQLAHYAADLHMPLHTTIHYNGRASRPRNPDGDWGPAPRSDIHARVDALPTKLPYNAMFTPPIACGDVPAELWTYITDQFARSHALVDRVYELEPRLPPTRDVTELSDPALRDFTAERSRAAAVFLANLYRIAWRDSASLQLPAWLDRDAFDHGFARDAILPQP